MRGLRLEVEREKLLVQHVVQECQDLPTNLQDYQQRDQLEVEIECCDIGNRMRVFAKPVLSIENVVEAGGGM